MNETCAVKFFFTPFDFWLVQFVRQSDECWWLSVQHNCQEYCHLNAFLQTFHAFFIGLIFCIFRAAEVRERIKRIKTASLASGIATEPLSSSQWEPHLGLKHEIFKPPHKMRREKESSCLFQEIVENVIRGSFVYIWHCWCISSDEGLQEMAMCRCLHWSWTLEYLTWAETSSNRTHKCESWTMKAFSLLKNVKAK